MPPTHNHGDSNVITVSRVDTQHQELYNNFVAASPFSSIYQSFEWGEIRKSDGWEVMRLVAEESGTVVGSASCLLRQIPLIGRKILYLPRGPVLDYEHEQGKEVFRVLLNAVAEIGRSNRVAFVRVNPDIRRDAGHESIFQELRLRPAATPILHSATFRIDLSKSEEALLGAMESRTRYDIRKAHTINVAVEEDDGTQDFLKTFYGLLTEVSQRNKFPIYSWELMHTIWTVLRPRNMCRIFLCRHGDQPVSGAFFLLFGAKCVYQWGASQRAELKVNPNQLMHWEAIRRMKALGFQTYDFQGVPENVKSGDPLWGIYLFKRGFGPEYVQLIGDHDLVLSKSWYAAWRQVEPHYAQLKRLLSKSPAVQ